jgi:hypothetical protein
MALPQPAAALVAPCDLNNRELATQRDQIAWASLPDAPTGVSLDLLVLHTVMG